MPALDVFAQEKIAALEAQHRLRTPATTARSAAAAVLRNGRRLVSFSCNDYLGLSQHSAVIEAAQQAIAQYGAGAGASRLVTGNHPLYDALEAALATYKHTEAACVFGSGYLANIGVIPAVAGRGDMIIADKLVHACILDGIKLSGAKLLRFAHNDAADCARLLTQHRHQFKHCLVVTETVFSMDGDVAPLAELRRLCDQHDAWLMTDDAHGIGTSDTSADIIMGTMSKALGAYGGYVCGSQALVRYLKTTARSLIFTTALPPPTVAAALKALEILRKNPALVQKPLAHARRFTQELGLPLAQSPIVPLILGSEEAALSAAQKLEQAGFLVSAIRPPTVPENSARLRFSFSAMHEKRDVSDLINSVKEIFRCHSREGGNP